MSGIKTGNKGFVNPVDGKVYSVVTGEEDPANPVNPVGTTYDPGDMTVDKTIKDISKPTRLTLGTYLSKATKGEVGSTNIPNKYPIDAPTADSLTSKIVENGYPAPLSPTTNSSKFAGNLPSSFSQDYSALQGAAGNDKVKKGLSSADGKDGNDLLPGVSVDPAIATVVSKYQTYSFVPNYRSPGTKFTAEDILSPSSGFDPKKVNYTSLTLKKPSEEAVNASDLSLNLESVVRTPQTLTTKNAYPVILPDENSAIIPVSTTTEGYPSPLTLSNNQNLKVFAGNLPSSFSNDFSSFQGTAGDYKIKKGLSPEKATDGNSLLKEVSIDANTQTTVLKYQNQVISLNTFNSNVSFIDLGSLPSKFFPQIHVVKVSGKYAGQPGDVISKDSLELSRLINFPVTITKNYKNKFPIVVSNLPNKPENYVYSSLVTNGVPTTLTPASSQNEGKVFAPGSPGTPEVKNVYSNFYTTLNVDNHGGIQKGKTGIDDPPGVSPDGNELLANVVIDKASNQITSPTILSAYSNVIIDSNTFDPKTQFFDVKSADILKPSATFEPTLNNIPQSEPKGQYEGIKKIPITLLDLYKHAVDVTTKNQYSIGPVPENVSTILGANVVEQGFSTPPLSTTNTEIYVSREQIKPLSTDPSLTSQTSLANSSNFSKGKSDIAAPYNGQNLLKDISGNLSFDDKLKNSNGRLDFKTSGLDSSAYQPGGVIDGDQGIDEFGSATGNSIVDEFHPLNGYKTNNVGVLSIGNNRWAARARSRSTFNPTLKLADGTPVSHLRMAKIGTGLLQRAAGEIPAWTADKFNPTGNLAEAGAILPSVVQVGALKVDNAQLMARDVLDHLSEGEEDPASLINIARGFTSNDQSWGAAYSSTESYDEPGSAIGLSLTMIAMVLAINLLYSLFLIGENTRKSSRKIADGAKGSTESDQQAKGSYIFVQPNSNSFFDFMPDPNEVFGLRKTNNSYSECVGYGVRAFFLGSEKASISYGEMALALAGIGLDAIIGENSPLNANLVVCRTIVRSALVFAIAIDSIIRKFNTSGLAGAKSILGLLRVFRSSKLVSSLNVFATLGDSLLDREHSLIRTKDADGKTIEIAAVDSLPAANNKIVVNAPTGKAELQRDNNGVQQATVQKSRLSYKNNYDPTLAWSNQRAPSMYLVPPTVSGLNAIISPSVTFPGIAQSAQRTLPLSLDKRIPTELREAFEKLLDAEYVPFYFQDVRTNEIISFHAFLSSLTDDYTSSYDSVDGFGRVEPVKIYKGTSRKIGMSFFVASTSEADFKQMWYKINKLLTLIYPQYTEGRDLIQPSQDGKTNFQFKAPFSQMIGASPLVRIRLGDLLRSNYSNSAIARLFGASDGNMKIPKDVNDTKGQYAAINANDLKEPDFKITSDTLPGTFLVVTNDMLGPIKDQELLRIELDIDKKDVVENKKFVAEIAPKNSLLNIGENDCLVRIKYEKTSKYVDLYFKSAALQMTEEQKAIERNRLGHSNPTEALTAFLDPNNNAIIKSFKSAGGKGLAGFIESMNFDWYNQTTWEIDPELGVAPKMCKVTLSFSPIHDISPGIDSHGYNRAPVYSVVKQ